MRRMLDPKEAGGGGEDKKLYCHLIRIGPKDGGEIYFNYTSTDETKLTKETIFPAIKSKNLICTGYVKINDSAKTLEYLYTYEDIHNKYIRVK